jgi:LPS sulfotransferase NodH
MKTKKPIKFVLLTTQRSGATFFLKYLSSHPEIACRHQAVFTQINKFKYLSFDRPSSFYYQYRSKSINNKFSHWFLRKKLICNFLNDYIQSLTQNAKAVGFKVSYKHIEKYPMVENWIRYNKAKIIHLIRSNILKTILSLETAKKRKMFHSSEEVENIKVYLSPNKLKRKLKRRTKQIDKFQKAFRNDNYIEIFYESLLSNRDYETLKVLKFLDVNNSILKEPDIVKMNPDTIEHIIKNYDEITQHLKNTIYEKYLSTNKKKQ